MITAPIPLDEQERLAALRALKILDTPPEERFDRVTRLAAKLFEVPIAYVAMIDSTRQWFKSKQGLMACQTPRDISFCGHAVLIDEALVIPDAQKDPRFADNPMVTGEPFVRFYAGQSLKTPDGKRVGTLCVVDRKPREFGDRDRAILRELADMIEKELSLVDIIKLQNEFLTTKQKLIESRAALAKEMAEAASYVASLIPPPVRAGAIQTDWIYAPSSELGGDAIGYHTIEGASGGSKMAIYLLDVAGHGVGAALLATTVISLLRTGALRNTDFADPQSVCDSLNCAFPMEEHGGRCFSIWYGVYDASDRSLRYVSAGHPPAIWLEPGRPGRPVRRLDAGGISIGMITNADYESERVVLPPGALLGLCSDGAYEFRTAAGEEFGWEAWERAFAKRLDAGSASTAGLMDTLKDARGGTDFPDDISILAARFN